MTANLWHWLWTSDDGLLLRIGLGLIVLATLAAVDVRRHGLASRRLREYGFLLTCVAAAMAYGVINDQITVSISWEYFWVHGQELNLVWLPNEPPGESGPLRLAAVEMGIKATWSAGLVIGVAVLLANNPSKRRRPLPWGAIYRLIPLVFAAGAGVAAAGGLLGYFTGGQEQSLDRRFNAVYYTHLGGYLGGLIGCVGAVVYILRRRRKIPADQ